MNGTGEALLSIISNTAEQLDEMSGVWPLLNAVVINDLKNRSSNRDVETKAWWSLT